MVIHTVRKGDSIYSISRDYGVPPSRIITDNMLSSSSKLVVGEDIIILFPTETYTVRGGDTLNNIASRYNIDLLELYRNNPVLGGTTQVYPGQVLNIRYNPQPYGEIITNGYAYPFINKETLRRTLPYLTYLSVFSYGIKENGDLIPPEYDDADVISISREYNTTPLMVLTSLSESGNFSSALAQRVLSDRELQKIVINNTVNTVKERGYGGVDVDFEYISSDYADSYVNFISELKTALGGDYPVFVSLAPKYEMNQRGLLYEGHDYSGLGEAADKVFVMTYEWGYTYGPPLPVSPINEVRRVLDYAITAIPRNKILMGVPNYGYDWKLPYVRGESMAESISNVEAVRRASAVGAEIEYDETAESPYYNYYDRPESFGDAVEHEVWFQNGRSSESLLRLVSSYRLSGFGVWNIMNYFPALWLVLNQLYKIKKIN